MRRWPVPARAGGARQPGLPTGAQADARRSGCRRASDSPRTCGRPAHRAPGRPAGDQVQHPLVAAARPGPGGRGQGGDVGAVDEHARCRRARRPRRGGAPPSGAGARRCSRCSRGCGGSRAGAGRGRGPAAPPAAGSRVGRRRGPVGSGLFRRPPSEPGVRLSPHPALQCLDVAWSRCRVRAVRVDGGVAGVADDQGLATACGHHLDPWRGSSARPGSVEVLAGADVVDLDAVARSRRARRSSARSRSSSSVRSFQTACGAGRRGRASLSQRARCRPSARPAAACPSRSTLHLEAPGVGRRASGCVVRKRA